MRKVSLCLTAWRLTECENEDPQVNLCETVSKIKATPTRSEMKIQDLYKIMDESPGSETDSDDEGSNSDASVLDDDVLISDQVIGQGGNRIIDFGIFSKKHLVTFCVPILSRRCSVFRSEKAWFSQRICLSL